MKKIVLTLACFLFTVFLFAQEGMWMLTQLGQLDLKKKGLEVSAVDLFSNDKPSLSRAVVQLGGGTASFVSPDGLLLTNHHVAFSALQLSSNTSSDYLTNGFLATSRQDEIKAPGYTARMVTEIRDVTDEVTEVVKGITNSLEKQKKTEEKILSITQPIEKGKEDVSATVSEMLNGRQYVLFVYKIFKDIRIVYSPPLAIGNYGGETDNWMWPRHTGDFSYMRVYVAKDGTSKAYSPDNVPYHPQVWLKIAKTALKDGDMTFVMGFPGFTTRYRTSTSVNWNLNYNYPFSIRNYHEIIALADEVTKNDPEGKIRVAGLVKGLANAMKNYEGKVEGMKKTNFLQKKIETEADFMKWVNSDPGRKLKYGEILAKEKEQYKLLSGNRDRDNVYGVFQGLSGTLFNVAFQAYFLAKEMEKPESERQSWVNNEAIDDAIESLQYSYTNYYEPMDKALFTRALKMASQLPAGQRIEVLDYIVSNQGASIDKFAGNAYSSSKLNDLAYAKSLYKKSSKELENLDDPFITLSAKLYPLSQEIAKNNELFSANVTDIRKTYIDALYDWKGSGMYPDANGTIRFTSGPVKGYRPADAVWYSPFTTLTGVIEKNRDEEPFNVPSGLNDLYKKKDFGRWVDPALKEVPVAFLSLCDITGGNSGSPIMNSKGEIAGIIFDGNYEAMISDWQYDLALQRAISVDIRYVLFITEKYGKADFLLKEMGL